jgi:lipopolysaccharide export system protein LptA
VFFEPAGSDGAAGTGPVAPNSGFSKLEPSRVEAEGTPVVIRSPSRGVQARGTRLEYDLKKNSGELKGPGWLKATRPDDARAQAIEATWVRELEFRPIDGAPCAQLVGKAHVESAGTGELNAETIQLFLIEDPTPPANPTDRRRLVPDRLQAFQRVRFDSPTLSGDVDHMQVWLRRPSAPGLAAGRPAAAATAGRPSASQTTTGNSATPEDSVPQAPAQHVHVLGKLLQVEALMGETSSDITRIHLEGNVRLKETKVAEAGARPMAIRGDQIDVDQPLPNHAIVHVFGQPAHVEAREIAIDGAAIHLDRAQNLSWVDGQGLMTLLVPSDPANQPAAQPRPVEITWKGGMEFDGRDAMFRDGVVAVMQQHKLTAEGIPTLEHQRLTCEVLQAVFAPRVIFDQMSASARPQISQIICRENVFLEQRTTQAGRPTSVERLKSVDLTAEPASGNLLARGPGWVRRVWVDTGTGPRLPGAPAAAPKPTPTPGEKRLAYLGVDFQGQFAGNQARQTTDFHQHVRCVYGPVPDWDTILVTDDPDNLSDGSVLLTSDHLQVVRTPAAADQAQPFELTADGNAKLDGRGAMTTSHDKIAAGKPPPKGQMYSANAARVTYSAAKDLMVLEGDGRNFAHLARQVRVGSAWDEQTAAKFLFWPSLNKVDVEGGHEMHIQNLDNGGPNRRNSNASRSGPATK